MKFNKSTKHAALTAYRSPPVRRSPTAAISKTKDQIFELDPQ